MKYFVTGATGFIGDTLPDDLGPAVLAAMRPVEGVAVTVVQILGVQVSDEMKKALGMQAVAERGQRAKVVAAEAEYQASTQLAEAAAVLRAEPAALHVRYLQALERVGNVSLSLPVESPQIPEVRPRRPKKAVDARVQPELNAVRRRARRRLGWSRGPLTMGSGSVICAIQICNSEG